MKNKKSLVAIVLLFLFLLIGATIAYFQSSASFENEFNTGKYKIVTKEVFESPSNWQPGEEIPKTITTKNEGTIPAAVRVSFTEKWEDSDGNDITNQIDDGTAIINLDNTSDWTKDGNYYYYNYSLEPGGVTSSFIKSVTLNPDLNDVSCTSSQDGKGQRCISTNKVNGSKYTLTLTKETVQYDSYKELWNNSPNISKIDFIYYAYGDDFDVSHARTTAPIDEDFYFKYKLVDKELPNDSVPQACLNIKSYGEICFDNDDYKTYYAKFKSYLGINEEWGSYSDNHSYSDDNITCDFLNNRINCESDGIEINFFDRSISYMNYTNSYSCEANYVYPKFECSYNSGR